MAVSQVDQFHPVFHFGYVEVDGKQVLHQMWVNPLGHSEYRPVPIVKLDPETRRPCVAGYVEDDADRRPGAVYWSDE